MRLVPSFVLIVLVSASVLASPAGETGSRPAAGQSLGAVEIGAGEAVQIRSLLSHTGANSLGASLRYGVELAVRDYGDLHGHAIELGAPLDSGCAPEAGRAGAGRITADARVIGVIGTSCSAAAVAVSPLLSAAGLVLVSPSNTSPRLTSDLAGTAGADHHPGYFRVSNNDLYGALAVADFAYGELGLRRMAAIHDGDPYTTALVDAFGAAFRDRGGELVASAGIDKGDTDLKPVLEKFAAAGPDGLFFPLFVAEGAAFAAQARAVDGLRDATLITGAAMLVSEFLGLPHSESIYFAGPESSHGGSVNVATGRAAAAVLAEFQAAHGAPTSPYWAFAYDAATLLLNAVETAAVAESGKLTVDRAALRAALTATRNFQGLTGLLSCDAFGDCGTGRINIYHHRDSRTTDAAQVPVVYRFSP